MGRVQKRLDWLLDLGLDMISTEMGTTEFSKTDPKDTIELLDAIVEYLASKGKELVVKNHAATGQFAAGYED